MPQALAFDGRRGSWPETAFAWLARERAKGASFLLKAYAVLFAINLGSFGWAVATAYPFKLHGMKAVEYAMIGCSVSLMGAACGVGSLCLTIWGISRAQRAGTNAAQVRYLAINLLISGLAIVWVLFGFMVSGWLVAQILPIHESLADRAHLYQRRLFNLVFNPTATSTLRTIYVGVIMGLSSLLPTIAHVAYVLWALLRPARPALAR